MIPDPPPDSDLIQRLRNRDPHALAAVYDLYSIPVYSLILHITRQQGTAEDIVQELFLRLWNRAHALPLQGATLRTWLLLTAKCMAVRHVRSLSNHTSKETLSLLARSSN